MARLKRVIRVYPSEGDELELEIDFPEMDDKSLHDIFCVPYSNPMFDVYKMDTVIANKINHFTNNQIEFDFDRFDYYLDYD